MCGCAPHYVLDLFSPGLRGEAGRVVPLPGPPGADGLPGSPGFQGPQGTFRVLSPSPGDEIGTFSGFSRANHWSCPQQVIEVSLEPREGLASQERGVLSASRGLDSQDLQAPKVSWKGEPNDEWAHGSGLDPCEPHWWPSSPGWSAAMAVVSPFIFTWILWEQETVNLNILRKLVTVQLREGVPVSCMVWRMVISVIRATGAMVPASKVFLLAKSWSIRGLEAAREAGRCYICLNPPWGRSLSSVKEIHRQLGSTPDEVWKSEGRSRTRVCKNEEGASFTGSRPLYCGVNIPTRHWRVRTSTSLWKL